MFDIILKVFLSVIQRITGTLQKFKEKIPLSRPKADV